MSLCLLWERKKEKERDFLTDWCTCAVLFANSQHDHDITPFIDIWHVTQRLCIRNRFFVADNILKFSINMLTQKKQGQQKVRTTDLKSTYNWHGLEFQIQVFLHIARRKACIKQSVVSCSLHSTLLNSNIFWENSLRSYQP